jgi:nicotinamidase-related amidase
VKQTACALLVIDMQQGAFDGVRLPPIHRASDLLERVEQLLAAARGSLTPVIHVQHCDEAGQAFEQGTPHWLFHPRVAPLPGEVVIQKRASSAFEGTQLQEVLEQWGTGTVVVCGLQSEFCVSNTSKSALALGLQVQVAADAHSTWPSAGRSAQHISDQVNRDLQGLGAVLLPTTGLVKQLAAQAA